LWRCCDGCAALSLASGCAEGDLGMEAWDPGCLELLRFFFGVAVLAQLLAILI
jgi:hypothetical protein